MRHALLRFAHLLGVDLTWYGKCPIDRRISRISSLYRR
jgi:hypothetical protein